MSWAGRRQGLYIGTATLIVLVVLGGLGYIVFSKPATCSDLVQNGSERGVDCGGACTRMCMQDVDAPLSLWTRAFMVAPGVYTATAYLENRNPGSYVRSAAYTFKLFDDKNVLIAERSGVTSLSPGRFVPIVESNISTGNRIVSRTFFEFSEELAWDRGEAPEVTVSSPIFDLAERRVTVRVRNESGAPLRDLPITAVLYDATNTAQGASSAKIARLERNAEEIVVFTWPTEFVSPPIRAEVLTQPIP